MAILPPPTGSTVMDPVIRSGRYLAVGTTSHLHLRGCWHVWTTDGTYIGYATDPGLISLVIARHENGHTP
ncbi:hypothetical protein B7P34_13440 [Streptosporangium nondiastaticum]|uniref:Uncharacterized protein n=2 Tax=Actinomycetes TaxID=1760 RepID=A0A9X7JQW0_9ACTN|nr:hypothetical protein [Streptosporangium nondiastaticum]PSJ28233.1 hypothetical protein B7P34_13440 [Streptosporangium nondiastaticum]